MGGVQLQARRERENKMAQKKSRHHPVFFGCRPIYNLIMIRAPPWRLVCSPSLFCVGQHSGPTGWWFLVPRVKASATLRTHLHGAAKAEGITLLGPIGRGPRRCTSGLFVSRPPLAVTGPGANLVPGSVPCLFSHPHKFMNYLG